MVGSNCFQLKQLILMKTRRICVIWKQKVDDYYARFSKECQFFVVINQSPYLQARARQNWLVSCDKMYRHRAVEFCHKIDNN